MKTPTKPTAPRMPRARVFITRNVNATSATPKAQRNNYTAVIPCRTAQQARKLAAFFNCKPEEQRERIGVITQRWMNGYALPAKYDTVADAVLAAITGGRTD